MPKGHACNGICYMCGRPYDLFKHVHLPHNNGQAEPLNADGEDTIVLCIPCIATVANMMSVPIAAYSQGGSVFDEYGRLYHGRLVRRRQTQGQQDDGGAPKWATDVLRDMEPENE